ncbi:PARP-domain-containing protein [Xylaria bambusicola]|uniref:PARP-domain-containing protein n=1 Tax=Xylaria bambusicola TaxID=326684 RepID=UPI0020082E5A|nr:PARP-domain-containing protein [Xylaria bambusicola]KAI0527712.1 PARP-domain-containing protein [Xylaria bambusicola]
MPPKKRTRSGKAGGSKKQKTAEGAKSSQPTIPIDEGFKEGGDVQVHIDDDGTIWDASLNLSNVSGNNNKFYMLQLLVDESNGTYYAHNRWGRVGETGQVKTMGFDDLESAKEEYDKKFKSKTGLKWEDRGQEPKDKKYTFVERSYDDDDNGEADAESDEGYGSSGSAKSELDISTQRLMELIFNENHFNSVLEEIGYNKDKLPLGKLGKSSLQKGFEQLKELSSLIKHPSLAKNKYNRDREEVIEEWTNKYYSTIPHVFGRDRPPLINNDDILRREVAMLDTLTDMEVANTIMNSNSKSKDAASVHKLDAHFQSLKLKELAVLEHSSQEYKVIQKYLLDSSAQQHSLKYRLQDIFRVERPGESDRFEKSTKSIKDSRRLLLWHGSRTTNFGDILSQGLRIAPPEAPVNGYAFGKGVYLADLSSKSANYCVSSLSGGVGLLMLVEAELSNPMYEITSGDSDAAEKARKKNCIATKGVGRTGPAAWKDASCVNKQLEGVIMPDGKPVDSKDHKGGYLMFNEYISYNVEHLKIRYLLKVSM